MDVSQIFAYITSIIRSPKFPFCYPSIQFLGSLGVIHFERRPYNCEIILEKLLPRFMMTGHALFGTDL